MVLSPAYARTSHHAGETLLVDADGVFDECKVDEGDLEDVKGKIALKDTGPKELRLVEVYTIGEAVNEPNTFVDDIGPCLEIGLTRLILKSQATQACDVGLGGDRKRVRID